MSQPQKLSVYPEADREITLVETSTELERQVGSLRRAIQRQTGDAVHKVKSGVNSVINVENRVESALATAYTDRVNQLVAKDESLTPNGLYVGVITLASMVFTRHRAFPIRWAVPPLTLLVSMRYFLPHTSDNLAHYYDKKEHQYFSRFSDERRRRWDLIKQHWHMGMDHLENWRNMSGRALVSGVQDIQERTGLQVGQLLPREETLPESIPHTAEQAQKKLL